MQFVQFNGATRKRKVFFPIKSTREDKNTALLTLRRIDRLNITYNYLRLFKTKIRSPCIKSSWFNSPKTGYPDQFRFSYISRKHNKSGKLLSTQQHQSFDLFKSFLHCFRQNLKLIFRSGVLKYFQLQKFFSSLVRLFWRFWERANYKMIIFKKRPLSFFAVGPQ